MHIEDEIVACLGVPFPLLGRTDQSKMFRPDGAGHLIRWIHFFSTLSLNLRALSLCGVSVINARTLICMSSALWYGREK